MLEEFLVRIILFSLNISPMSGDSRMKKFWVQMGLQAELFIWSISAKIGQFYNNLAFYAYFVNWKTFFVPFWFFCTNILELFVRVLF